MSSSIFKSGFKSKSIPVLIIEADFILCMQSFLNLVECQTLYLQMGWYPMEPYAIIDESGFPTVRIRFTGNKSSDQNFQSYLDQTKACYRFGKSLAIIFDASNAGIPSLSHQKMQADWLKENKELMQQYCVGTAYVIPNVAIRAILKMIFSFQKQPVPYQIFENEEEAKAWVKNLELV